MTTQISKVIERLLGRPLQQFLLVSGAYGPCQFAYSRGRGHRDALAFNVCSWLRALSLKKRIALYCSDVSRAFDRVASDRLLLKLKRKGVHARLVAVIRSWFRNRVAHVVVDGVRSRLFTMKKNAVSRDGSRPTLVERLLRRRPRDHQCT